MSKTIDNSIKKRRDKSYQNRSIQIRSFYSVFKAIAFKNVCHMNHRFFASEH